MAEPVVRQPNIHTGLRFANAPPPTKGRVSTCSACAEATALAIDGDGARLPTIATGRRLVDLQRAWAVGRQHSGWRLDCGGNQLDVLGLRRRLLQRRRRRRRLCWTILTHRSTSVGARTSPPAMATNLTCSESAEATGADAPTSSYRARRVRVQAGDCSAETTLTCSHNGDGVCDVDELRRRLRHLQRTTGQVRMRQPTSLAYAGWPCGWRRGV